jgi:hypothetical protein
MGAGAVVEAEVLRNYRRLDNLIGERDPDGVVTEAFDVVDDRVIVLRPQAVRDLVRGFEPVPVDARDPDRVAGRVEDLVAAGMPVARANATGRGGGMGGRGARRGPGGGHGPGEEGRQAHRTENRRPGLAH